MHLSSLVSEYIYIYFSLSDPLMAACLNLPLIYSVLRENSFLWAFQWLFLFSELAERSVLSLLLINVRVRPNSTI